MKNFGTLRSQNNNWKYKNKNFEWIKEQIKTFKSSQEQNLQFFKQEIERIKGLHKTSKKILIAVQYQLQFLQLEFQTALKNNQQIDIQKLAPQIQIKKYSTQNFLKTIQEIRNIFWQFQKTNSLGAFDNQTTLWDKTKELIEKIQKQPQDITLQEFALKKINTSLSENLSIINELSKNQLPKKIPQIEDLQNQINLLFAQTKNLYQNKKVIENTLKNTTIQQQQIDVVQMYSELQNELSKKELDSFKEKLEPILGIYGEISKQSQEMSNTFYSVLMMPGLIKGNPKKIQFIGYIKDKINQFIRDLEQPDLTAIKELQQGGNIEIAWKKKEESTKTKSVKDYNKIFQIKYSKAIRVLKIYLINQWNNKFSMFQKYVQKTLTKLVQVQQQFKEYKNLSLKVNKNQKQQKFVIIKKQLILKDFQSFFVQNKWQNQVLDWQIIQKPQALSDFITKNNNEQNENQEQFRQIQNDKLILKDCLKKQKQIVIQLFIQKYQKIIELIIQRVQNNQNKNIDQIKSSIDDLKIKINTLKQSSNNIKWSQILDQKQKYLQQSLIYDQQQKQIIKYKAIITKYKQLLVNIRNQLPNKIQLINDKNKSIDKQMEIYQQKVIHCLNEIKKKKERIVIIKEQKHNKRLHFQITNYKITTKKSKTKTIQRINQNKVVQYKIINDKLKSIFELIIQQQNQQIEQLDQVKEKLKDYKKIPKKLKTKIILQQITIQNIIKQKQKLIQLDINNNINFFKISLRSLWVIQIQPKQYTVILKKKILYNSHIKIHSSILLFFKFSTLKKFNKNVIENINCLKQAQLDFQNKINLYQNNLQNNINAFITGKQNNEKLWFLISTNVKEIKVIWKTLDSQIYLLQIKQDEMEIQLKESRSNIQAFHLKEKEFSEQKNDFQNQVQILQNKIKELQTKDQQQINNDKEIQKNVDNFNDNIQNHFPLIIQSRNLVKQEIIKKNIQINKIIHDQNKDTLVELLFFCEYLINNQILDPKIIAQINNFKQTYQEHKENNNKTNNQQDITKQTQNKENQSNTQNLQSLKNQFFIDNKIPEILQDLRKIQENIQSSHQTGLSLAQSSQVPDKYQKKSEEINKNL